MSRWTEPEGDDTERADKTPHELEYEADHFWSGWPGISIRFGLFAAALSGLYIGALATSGPERDEAGAEKVVAVKRTIGAGAPVAIAPQPAVAAPASLPSEPRPIQGPNLPRRMTLAPQALCDLINVDERANKWRRSPVYPDEWECMSSRAVTGRKQTASASSAAYNVFSMARGVGKTNVRHIRFKLSAPNQAGLDQASALILDRLGALFDAQKWLLPEHVSLAMRLQQPVTLREQGTTFQLVKERMSASSYNLIVTFPKPDKVAGPKAGSNGKGGSSDEKPARSSRT